MSQRSRVRRPWSTPAVVFGSLAVALGLTAVGNTEAQAGGEGREHARLSAEDDPANLRILDWALWNVSKSYVEAARVTPAAMTRAGIEALESAIPEVLVLPAGGDKVKVRVGTTEREFDANASALWAVGPQVREVFAFVNDHTTLSAEDQREAEYAIVEGVLATLDPHTNLLRPAAYEDMRTNTSGHFGGLGIEVGMREGELTVLRVLPGNPAAKVGLKAGDVIVQIDDESTVTMTLNEAVGLMRGQAGTDIAIHVRRQGLDGTKKFDIERAIIKLDSVIGEILPGVDEQGQDVKIGLVQIPRNFAEPTGKELREKLREFEKAGVTGIVLDMRDNPGGLLTAAVEVADAFIDTGTIVATVGENSPREESRAKDNYQLDQVPLVVLVDQGSASATEIVAGALRNLDRAVIVGRRTFGKGSVQTLNERRVGDTELALKLTIAQYLTPGDVSIQSVGVSPDLETVPVFIGEEHLAYYGSARFDLVREESLSAHLESAKTTRQPITAGPLRFLAQGSVADGNEALGGRIELAESADQRVDMLLADPELRIARDLVLWSLEKAPSASRSDILSTLPQFMAEQETIEDARISTSLASKKIDWAEGPAPTAGTAAKLEVTLSTNKPKDTIRGGEKGELSVEVTNVGDAPAYQVRAMSDSDYRYYDERELMFGKIMPGETKRASFSLTVAAYERSRVDRIDFEVFSQHDAAIDEASKTSIDIAGQGLDRPSFVVGYQVIDDPRLGDTIEGNGDGLLQVGEHVKLRIYAQNNGPGEARDARVQLRNGSGDAVFLHEGRGKLGELAVGESGFVDLDFEVQKGTPEVDLQLTVSDNKIGEYVMEELLFPIMTPISFDANKQGVEAKGAIDLYASPYDGAPVLARADAGTRFAALGAGGGWYKVETGKGEMAFVRGTEIDAGGKAPRKAGATEAVYVVSPPRIELGDIPLQTAAESISLSGVAVDGEQVRDVYVMVSNPSRDIFGSAEKVYYEASANPSAGRLEFSTEVPLRPGNNYVEIYARENDQVTGVRRMWILRTSGLAEARAQEGQFESSGQLSVDTFNNGR